jgi:hypothetical protein
LCAIRRKLDGLAKGADVRIVGTASAVMSFAGWVADASRLGAAVEVRWRSRARAQARHIGSRRAALAIITWRLILWFASAAARSNDGHMRESSNRMWMIATADGICRAGSMEFHAGVNAHENIVDAPDRVRPDPAVTRCYRSTVTSWQRVRDRKHEIDRELR